MGELIKFPTRAETEARYGGPRVTLTVYLAPERAAETVPLMGLLQSTLESLPGVTGVAASATGGVA